jgi:hypothetical protein
MLALRRAAPRGLAPGLWIAHTLPPPSGSSPPPSGRGPSPSAPPSPPPLPLSRTRSASSAIAGRVSAAHCAGARQGGGMHDARDMRRPRCRRREQTPGSLWLAMLAARVPAHRKAGAAYGAAGSNQVPRHASGAQRVLRPVLGRGRGAGLARHSTGQGAGVMRLGNRISLQQVCIARHARHPHPHGRSQSLAAVPPMRAPVRG